MNNGARAGMELVTSILGGAGIGWALDNWLHTKPWLMIVCLFVGLAAGFRSVYKISQDLAVRGGSAALQKAQKTGTKPPEFNEQDLNEDDD
jgi:F0F1-type ATP synthase assembly protein I